jgi:L-gulonate 5-dehydrogenase
MRAAVTKEPNVMEMADVPDAREPGPGEALLRTEAVGLCGSDYHFLTGEIVTTTVHGPQFPKIQGHEVSAIIEKLGPDAPSHLQEGQRVAIWPLRGCGECYACSIGRANVCPNFSLIGIHVDGALAQHLTLPVDQLFPVGDLEPAIAAFVEPISIAVHAVNRGRVAEGERVVVLGAGPIGQALSIAARERGAKVLLVDLVASRLELGRFTGADVLDASGVDDVVAEARAWSGGEGPQVVFDAVGVPRRPAGRGPRGLRGPRRDRRDLRAPRGAFDQHVHRQGDRRARHLGVRRGRVRGGRRDRRAQRRHDLQAHHAQVPARAGAGGDRLGDGQPAGGAEGRRGGVERRVHHPASRGMPVPWIQVHSSSCS